MQYSEKGHILSSLGQFKVKIPNLKFFGVRKHQRKFKNGTVFG